MDYIKQVSNALKISLSQSNVYSGKDGALRLAREVGSCLNDSPDDEARAYFDRSYNEVCVIGYNLKPPIDKREWDNEIMKKWGIEND